MRHWLGYSILSFLMIASATTAGCGGDDDGGTPGTDAGTAIDASTGMDAPADIDGGGEPVSCTGIDDGIPCDEDTGICVGGNCVTSRCGDGFVDTARGEDCEDGNDVAGDGCEPATCTYTCTDAPDCDDEDPCNGTETCLPELHRCQVGTVPTDPTDCTLESGDPGACTGGLCVPPGCGNGVVDDGEECDDSMNGDNADGCRDDCRYSCSAELPCDDGDACNGEETCDDGTHTCTAGTALDCNDSEPCTADSCDAADGCVNALIDRDGDGFAPEARRCANPAIGGDCDDGNNTVHPGAAELCDMIDNDCDDMTDEDVTSFTCYPDIDGDGYPVMSGGIADQCTCGADHMPARPDAKWDCYDSTSAAGADVHPDQTAYFESGFCNAPRGVFCRFPLTNFDYNCSAEGTSAGNEPYWTRVNHSACGTRTCYDGWTGAEAPACGQEGEFRDCGWVIDLRTGTRSCRLSRALGNRRQQCH